MVAVLLSLVAVLSCSVATFISSSILSVNQPWTNANMSKLLMFGAGTMLGDVFFHIIPHLFHKSSSLSHEHSHQNGSNVFFILGVTFCLAVELITNAVINDNKKELQDSNKPDANKENDPIVATMIADPHSLPNGKKSSIELSKTTLLTNENTDDSGQLQQTMSKKFSCSKPEIQIPPKHPNIISLPLGFLAAINWSGFQRTIELKRKLKPIAATNLIADLIHNFIDGICISLSFLVSPSVGISTSLAILLHELSQELADFTLLRNSGLSFDEALSLNVMVSFFCFFGWAALWACSLISSSFRDISHTISQYFLPFSGGALLYMGMVEMLPEAIHMMQTKQHLKHPLTSWKVSPQIEHILWFLGGVGLLFGVTFFE